VPRNLPRGEIPDAAWPPLGCSFHPRCRHAFEVCGWEARDLRSLLEQRWTQREEAVYAAEQALVGDLAQLESGDSELRLRPGAGTSADLHALLDAVRREDPAEPFWRGVAGISVDGDAVVITFRDAVDPELLAAGGASVACHLYDPAYRDFATR
jgi:peptide/nickel transport system ATP-binding protein